MYLGEHWSSKSYALFYVLTPGFAKHDRAPDGSKLWKAGSKRGLPRWASAEIKRAVKESAGHDEMTWYWLTLSALESDHWDRPCAVQYIHGPGDYARFLEKGEMCRRTVAHPSKEAELAESGFRRVSHEEMAEHLRAHPEGVSDAAPTSGPYTVVEGKRSLAESLGFAETLRWLRSFDDPERIRLCLRVEI